MQTKDIPDWLVLLAHLEYRRCGMSYWPYEILEKWIKSPEKVAYRAMERACRHGFLEYGVSLRTAWVEPEGFEYLSDCLKYKIESQEQYDIEYLKILKIASEKDYSNEQPTVETKDRKPIP